MAKSIRAVREAPAPADPKGGDLRARILKASVDLIDEQGLDALSMRGPLPDAIPDAWRQTRQALEDVFTTG